MSFQGPIDPVPSMLLSLNQSSSDEDQSPVKPSSRTRAVSQSPVIGFMNTQRLANSIGDAATKTMVNIQRTATGVRSMDEIRAARAQRRKSQKQELSALGLLSDSESASRDASREPTQTITDMSLAELTSGIPAVGAGLINEQIITCFNQMDLNHDGAAAHLST